MFSSETNHDLPLPTLKVLKDLSRYGFMLDQSLGLAGDSIVQALKRRGFVTTSLRAIAPDGSLLPEGHKKDRSTRIRKILEITPAGIAFVNSLPKS
jgi:hypothetical protein